MKINFYGDVFGETGYASHCRGLLEGLHEAGHELKIESARPADWERKVNDWQLKAFNTPFMPDGVSIAVTTPPFWNYYLSYKPKKFIGFLVWEGDKIPKSWIEHLLDERVSQVWVPSQHVKDAVLKTFYDNCYDSQFNKKTLQIFLNKIKIVPHGVKVNLEVFYPEK